MLDKPYIFWQVLAAAFVGSFIACLVYAGLMWLVDAATAWWRTRR